MNQPRPPRQQAQDSNVTDDELRQIIVEGDARTLVECAQKLGDALAAARLKASQIRRIFGTVRQIEMDWPAGVVAEGDEARATRARRDLILLEPKIAYQEQRESAVRPLGNVLKRSIRLVANDRERFQHFVEFFEATLAYHRAGGGSNT